MSFYIVSDTGSDLMSNTRIFRINEVKTIDGDSDDFSDITILSNDYKVARYRDINYRVCRVELDDEDISFIKVW